MRSKSKAGTPEFGDAYWIGAHIDHTIVDADGVRTVRIHEWPDKLMEWIVPMPNQAGASHHFTAQHSNRWAMRVNSSLPA